MDAPLLDSESAFLGLGEPIPEGTGGLAYGWADGAHAEYAGLGTRQDDAEASLARQIELSHRLLGIASVEDFSAALARTEDRNAERVAASKAEALKEMLDAGSRDPGVARAKEAARDQLYATALADVRASRDRHVADQPPPPAPAPPPAAARHDLSALWNEPETLPPRADEVEFLRTQVAELRDAVAVAQSRCVEQKSRAESAETRLEDVSARVAELELAHRRAEERALMAESAVEAAHVSARTQKREAEGASVASARAVADADQLRAQLSNARTENEQLRRQLDDGEAARQAAAVAAEARLAGEAEAKQRLARVEQELADSRDASSNAKVQIADLTRALERTEVQAAQLRKAEAVHKARAGQLELELEKAKARTTQLREEKDELFARYKNMEAAALNFQAPPAGAMHRPPPAPAPPPQAPAPPPPPPESSFEALELADMYRQRAEEQEHRLRRLEQQLSARAFPPPHAVEPRAAPPPVEDWAAEAEASLPPPRREMQEPPPRIAPPMPPQVPPRIDWEDLLPPRPEALPPAGVPSVPASNVPRLPLAKADALPRMSLQQEERPPAGAPTTRDGSQPPLGLGAAAALGAAVPFGAPLDRPGTAPALGGTGRPYATEASAEELMQRTAGLEAQLLQLSIERDTINATLNKIGPTSGRTLSERRAKQEGEARLDELNRAIGHARLQLRKLAG